MRTKCQRLCRELKGMTMMKMWAIRELIFWNMEMKEVQGTRKVNSKNECFHHTYLKL
jgi:hypothetical protein